MRVCVCVRARNTRIKYACLTHNAVFVCCLCALYNTQERYRVIDPVFRVAETQRETETVLAGRYTVNANSTKGATFPCRPSTDTALADIGIDARYSFRVFIKPRRCVARKPTYGGCKICHERRKILHAREHWNVPECVERRTFGIGSLRKATHKVT